MNDQYTVRHYEGSTLLESVIYTDLMDALDAYYKHGAKSGMVVLYCEVEGRIRCARKIEV